jgi:hypothetical protein
MSAVQVQIHLGVMSFDQAAKRAEQLISGCKMQRDHVDENRKLRGNAALLLWHLRCQVDDRSVRLVLSDKLDGFAVDPYFW